MHKLDIWLIDFKDSVGHEQKNQRPSIIWKDFDHLGMAIIIPLTSSAEAERFSYTCLISQSLKNGLSQDSTALLFQIKSIDKQRFIKKVGELDQGDVSSIAGVLKDMLRL